MDQAVYRFGDDGKLITRWTWYENGTERWIEEIELSQERAARRAARAGARGAAAAGARGPDRAGARQGGPATTTAPGPSWPWRRRSCSPRGWSSEWSWPRRAGGGPSGARYLLLLESPADERPAEEEARVTAIVDWARRQRAAGTKLSGEKLADGGYAVTAAGSHGLPGAPYVLGGYFVVSACDDDEARRIAASHPLVGWGGRIILRRIQEL